MKKKHGYKGGVEGKGERRIDVMQEKKNDVEEALGIKAWEISPPPLGEGKTLKKKNLILPPTAKKNK